MKKIEIEDFDIEKLADIVVKFLRKHGEDPVRFGGFDFDVDDYVFTQVPLDKLKEEMKIYYQEEIEFEFETKGGKCRFSYGGLFYIDYPEDLEEEMKVFKGNLL